MDNILSVVSTGILTGSVTAYFTARYALTRFTREQWWNKRADLYIQLVESIYAIKKEAAYSSEELTSKRTGFHIPSLELNEDEIIKIKSDRDCADIELRKISDLAPLLLNETCKKLIDRYIEVQDNLLVMHNYDEIETEDAVNTSLANVSTLLDEIIKEAKKELRSDHRPLEKRLVLALKWLKNKISS